MLQTKDFNLSIKTVVLRFYFMMAVVLFGGFTGMWWIATLALPIFISIMLGTSFKWEKKTSRETKLRSIQKANTQLKAS